jgi:hypothetical protein
MRKCSSGLILIIILLGINSCKDDLPVVPPDIPPDPIILKDTLAVSITDITHRSLTINVSTTQNNPRSVIKLFRSDNSSEIILAEYPIEVKDTSLIDDNNGAGLDLNKEYSYYALRTDSLGERKDSSNIVTAATLNATSHEYTWEEFIIGEFQSSLYDVWGTDENNVWAVGTCILNDTAYGVLRWDGTSWKPEKKIGGLQVIYGFSEYDIWAVGGGVWYYNGVWEKVDAKSVNNQLFPLDSVLFHNTPYTAMWGTSSSNMYFGNNKGKIIHWDGKKAKVLYDFGIYITDINGTSEDNIWITGGGANIFIAKYDGSIFEILSYPPPIIYSLYTVFPLNRKEVYVGGDGIYRKKEDAWLLEDADKNLGVIHKIRGTASNNIFAVGAFCTVYHFNGVDWKYYNEIRKPEGGIQYGVFVTENKVFIVGINHDHYRAKIIIGTRK